MDMAFLRRAERMLAYRHAARLDHSILIATLAAQQSTIVAARVQVHASAGAARRCEDDPLIELLLAGPGWRQALRAQRGCFSRAEAGRRINLL